MSEDVFLELVAKVWPGALPDPEHDVVFCDCLISMLAELHGIASMPTPVADSLRERFREALDTLRFAEHAAVN